MSASAQPVHAGGRPDTDPYESALAAAVTFAQVMAGLDRQARRQQRTLPSDAERQTAELAFWRRLVPELAAADATLTGADRENLRHDVEAVLNPWLLRSRFWARSAIKPHGFAGDYRMLEWMYDLERDECAHPDQPAVVNLLDGLYRSVHSVQAVWHRRGWFSELLERAIPEGRPVRVLDVACGGSRYVRDLIDRCGPRAVEPTFVDQDPAALSFVRSWLPAPTRARTICCPVGRLGDVLRPESDDLSFDVVISTGLFDYLPGDVATDLVGHMGRLTRPGGIVAICNFSPEDASRVVKEWVVDWRLIYRTDRELVGLFPPGVMPRLERSPDGGLLYAHATH